MSGIGSTRARKERTIQDRVSEALTESDKALVADLKRFSDVSNSTAGEAGASANNSPTAPAGNYLARKGDAMLGAFGLSPPLDFTIDINSDNTINISPLNGNPQYSSNIQLEDVPTSTTLDIIAGATFDGQFLFLRTFAPNPITISQGTLDNGGNIQTPDDTDVILGDLQMIVFVFDEALRIGENTGGTWRLLNTFGTGAVTTDASVAQLALSLPPTPTTGVTNFNDNTFIGSGISPTTEDGVFQLSQGVFQLNSSIFIFGTGSTLVSQWQSSSTKDGTFTDIGIASVTFTLDITPSSVSIAPISSAVVDATSGDVFVRLFTASSGSAAIQAGIGTWGQIFSIGGGDTGGTGTTFPILYPKENLTPLPNGTATIDVSINTGNAKQIEFPTGNINFEISGDPANTVGEDVYVLFIQDGTGGRSLTSVDIDIKNGSLMDSLLDKAANARTLFRLATLDGGLTYFATLVDLSTSAGGLLSTLAIDTDKDWAGRFITNLAGIDLFANSVANAVNNASFMSFVGDGAESRGSIGRSDGNATIADGVFINIAGDQTFTISDDAVPRLTADFNLNRLDTFNLSVKIENDSTNALLTLFRNETATIGDELGAIFFEGRNGNDNDDFIYSSIQSTILNATAGQEAASIELRAAQGSNISATSLILNADNSRILRWQSNQVNDLVAPTFELLATTEVVETGVNPMGIINFDATTNNGVIIQPVATFAQIIVDQEDANVATESASMRFRVRDKTSIPTTVGALKTYLQFNRESSEIIEALKDVTLENLSVNPVLTFFRNDTPTVDGLPIGNIIFKSKDDNGGEISYSAITSNMEDITSGQLDSSITLSTIRESNFGFVKLVVNADGNSNLRFQSASQTAFFLFPTFELAAVADVVPATGASQTIGEFNFTATANNGASGIIETFAQIISVQDESDTDDESASLRFKVRDQNLGNPGALQTYLQFNRSKSQQIQALRDLDMNDNPILNMGGETINALTADGTPDGATDFVMTYDASTATLKKVLLNNLPGGGGQNQTPWLTDIDAATFDLRNISNVEFKDASTSPPAANIFAIFVQSGSLVLNAPVTATGDIDFRIQAGNKMVLSATALTLTTGTNLIVAANFAQFSPITQPADGDVGNSQGNVFFDNSTDPAILKIIKKSSAGAVSVVSLEGAGGGQNQTPWLTDIDAATFDLRNVSNVEFKNASTSPPAANIFAVFVQSNSLVLKSGTTDIDFRISAANKMVLTTTSLTLRDGVDLLPTNSTNNDIGSNSQQFENAFFDGFIDIENISTPATPSAATQVKLFLDSTSGELSVRKFGGTTVSLEAGGGSGDMILAATQTVTGAKTFNDDILKIRNPANTASYIISSGAITADRTLSLPTLLAADTLLAAFTASPMSLKTINADLNTITNIGATEIKSDIITGQTLKNTPVAADSILISDSAAGGALKRTTLTSLIGGGVNLLPLNNTWTGVNTFTASIFNVNSTNITLGDEASDNINFTGRMNTSIVWNANSSPLGSTENGISLQQSGVIEINATNAVRIEEDGNIICSFSSSGFGPLSSANIKLFVTSSGALAPINIQPKSGVPSSVINGDIFYDTTGSHTLFARINNVNVDLGAGGGSVVDLDGIQDFEIWQLQNTTQFTHDVYMTNSKSGTTATGGTGVSLNQDVGWWVPIYLAKRSRIIRMGLEITGGASPTSNVVMGIYSNRTDGQNYPLTRQSQSSALLSNTASAQIISIPATNLEVGLYWLVVASTSGNLDCIFTLEGESNCVGYQLNTVGTDHFGAILGYTSVQSSTTLPITAPNNMDIANTLGTGIPMVFAIFNANTS